MPEPMDTYSSSGTLATLTVTSLAESLQWYRDVLGFEVVSTLPGSDGLPVRARLRWAPNAEIVLIEQDPAVRLEGERGIGFSLTFWAIGRSVGTIAEQARTQGADIVGEPTDQSWGLREIVIYDPDCYRLIFAEPQA
ncbi:MAG: VOC family protein [Aphanocapsa lilacina HA4352-LM1]|nr:VOC family protein [Aphanocapsa lilacina HA4352-LM1]